MAKSKIIKEYANGTIDTITALKRTKVLLSEFDNEELNNWISHEITGYPSSTDLPQYRVIRGNLVGSYIVGPMSVNNASLPLGKMPSDRQDDILNIQFREGIESLKILLNDCSKEGSHLSKPIPADNFPYIAKYNSPYMLITSARVEIGYQCIQNIISTVEDRLIEILIILEKEFGNLDDLDINIHSKSEKMKANIIHQIQIIIYDQSVSIGDNNTIKNSKIASSIKE